MSNPHPELARLLAALNESPADDALWLVGADWLDDHGQAPRAELARLNRRLRGISDSEWRHASASCSPPACARASQRSPAPSG